MAPTAQWGRARRIPRRPDLAHLRRKSPAHARSSWMAMDAGRRSAASRGPPGTVRMASKVIHRVIERWPTTASQHLTLYAFSTENWNRPRREVRTLIRLRYFIKRELNNLHRNGIRLKLLGPIWKPFPIGFRKVADAILHRQERSHDAEHLLQLRRARRHPDRCPRRWFAPSSMPRTSPKRPSRAISRRRARPTLTWSSALAATCASRTSSSGNRPTRALLHRHVLPDFGREDTDIALAEYGRRSKFGASSPKTSKP